MAVDEKEVWLVRGDVRGMSRYPKEDTNIYDVRGPAKVGYHEMGWCGEDGFGSSTGWCGPSEDNI